MAAPRRDAQGRFTSGRSMAGSAHIIGLPELERVLRELASMGATAATAVIGTDIVDPPYPYYLEYGTSRMPAYPAARPAVDEMGETAVRTTADMIGQAVVRKNFGPDVVRVAVREGARPIENRWKELARYRTGTYRRSIHTEVVDGAGP